jgi:predicted dehydrogenase
VLATRAMQIYTKMAGEDSGSMLFASRYGWRAHLLLNWAGPRGHSPDLIVSGESGVLHLWPGRRYYDLYPAAQGAVNQMLSFVRPASLGERFMKPEYDRVRRITPETDAQGYLSEVREFLACVAEERAPCTAPEDGRRDVQIVLCAYASLWQDAWVSIPQIEPSTVAGVGG